ncbi:MAG TPA: hypothetical protein VJ063_12835 [Verrucomicrobiae bacterium]|nr:hypothetical protein [Verrucomicrobiae bacterium]
MSPTICDILYIEDQTDDAYLFQRAFEKSAIPCSISVVENIPTAICYLKGEAPFVDRARFPFPNLIVADFALHIADGIAFIQWLRSEPALARVNLICLSSVEDPLKVSQIRELAVTFMQKSILFDDVISLIRSVVPI